PHRLRRPEGAGSDPARGRELSVCGVCHAPVVLALDGVCGQPPGGGRLQNVRDVAPPAPGVHQSAQVTGSAQGDAGWTSRWARDRVRGPVFVSPQGQATGGGEGSSRGGEGMESSYYRAQWLTRRAVLGTAASAVLGAYGLSLGRAGEIPTVVDGRHFTLRAP